MQIAGKFLQELPQGQTTGGIKKTQSFLCFFASQFQNFAVSKFVPFRAAYFCGFFSSNFSIFAKKNFNWRFIGTNFSLRPTFCPISSFLECFGQQFRSTMFAKCDLNTY